MTTPLPTLTVIDATWVPDAPFGAFWNLTTERCPSCGAKSHRHGGGNGPEPSLGLRVAHCPTSHKAFRDDCLAEKNAGGQWRCRIEHAQQYELVPVA